MYQFNLNSNDNLYTSVVMCMQASGNNFFVSLFPEGNQILKSSKWIQMLQMKNKLQWLQVKRSDNQPEAWWRNWAFARYINIWNT